MSNTLLYDPLLVRYLARELDRRLRGRACAAAPLFAPERVVLLPLDGGEALRLDLHPRRGWVRLVPWEESGDELDSVCLGVEAPPDERRLSVRLRSPDRFRAAERRLVTELHTNQWNALLLSEDARVLTVLWARTTGTRALRPGQPYEPPPAVERYGAGEPSRAEAWERWRSEVGGAEPAERRGVLLRGFAFVGTTNVHAILGPAAESAGEGELRGAFERWWALRGLPAPRPVLVRGPKRRFPYPFPLPDLPGEPVGSLLEGMARLADREEAPAPEQTERAALLAGLQRRAAAAARKVSRLEEELADTGKAEGMRAWGDLLLAHLHQVPRGKAEVQLTGWEGEDVAIPLDPALSPAENAARWYDEARRRGRAEERLPALLDQARAEQARWESAMEEAEAGELPEWARRALETEAAVSAPEGEGESRPYRLFRTSGGLEVRVGRSARANDRLTFGHSSPNDVWLHARSVPGSHVVLRWTDSEASPPGRDLAEAAGLAAWFSKARTSALVPVDWTRRKYVRKPRGAPPGAVIPQRVKTLFVEPDAALEERLRAD